MHQPRIITLIKLLEKLLSETVRDSKVIEKPLSNDCFVITNENLAREVLLGKLRYCAIVAFVSSITGS